MKLIWALMLISVHASKTIRCINFYGLETPDKKFVCSWKHPPEWYLSQLKDDLGINTIRLPFSGDYIKENNWTLMDNIFEVARTMNLSIILDWHRNVNSHQSASPLVDMTYEQWKLAWFKILDRYVSRPSLVGVGIFNEFQSTDTGFVYSTQFQLLEDLICRYRSNWTYYIGCPIWGTNCSGIHSYTDHGLFNKTRIEVHKYPFNQGAWDKNTWDSTIPNSISAQQWFMGEIGWKQQEADWGRLFLDYLRKRGIYNLCFWTIAHSSDTGGLWKDDCETPEAQKILQLKHYWDSQDSSVPHAGMQLLN